MHHSASGADFHAPKSSSNVIRFDEARARREFVLHDSADPDFQHFGVCPVCGETDGLLNVGKDHYFVCHDHRLFWAVGSNLFSAWQQETDEDWERNAELLGRYTQTVDEVAYWWLASHPRRMAEKGKAWVEARRREYRAQLRAEVAR